MQHRNTEKRGRKRNATDLLSTQDDDDTTNPRPSKTQRTTNGPNYSYSSNTTKTNNIDHDIYAPTSVKTSIETDGCYPQEDDYDSDHISLPRKPKDDQYQKSPFNDNESRLKEKYYKDLKEYQGSAAQIQFKKKLQQQKLKYDSRKQAAKRNVIKIKAAKAQTNSRNTSYINTNLSPTDLRTQQQPTDNMQPTYIEQPPQQFTHQDPQQAPQQNPQQNEIIIFFWMITFVILLCVICCEPIQICIKDLTNYHCHDIAGTLVAVIFVIFGAIFLLYGQALMPQILFIAGIISICCFGVLGIVMVIPIYFYHHGDCLHSEIAIGVGSVISNLLWSGFIKPYISNYNLENKTTKNIISTVLLVLAILTGILLSNPIDVYRMITILVGVLMVNNGLQYFIGDAVPIGSSIVLFAIGFIYQFGCKQFKSSIKEKVYDYFELERPKRNYNSGSNVSWSMCTALFAVAIAVFWNLLPILTHNRTAVVLRDTALGSFETNVICLYTHALLIYEKVDECNQYGGEIMVWIQSGNWNIKNIVEGVVISLAIVIYGDNGFIIASWIILLLNKILLIVWWFFRSVWTFGGYNRATV